MAQIANWQVANWYERKFDFSFPVELYPDLCMRLRGTPARLEEHVRRCPAERMVRAAQGTWSAQEHAGHLLDLEPLWMARVEDYVAGRSELSVADLSNRGTFEAKFNDRALEKILADFRRARIEMADRVEKIDAALFGRVLVHPRLKAPMRLVDHLFFVAEHDDHHLAIIWGMIREE
ncbi:MAG: DinB family protein [Terriglobales bacterium]